MKTKVVFSGAVCHGFALRSQVFQRVVNGIFILKPDSNFVRISEPV